MKEKALKIAEALDKFDKNSISSLFDVGRGASIIRDLVAELERVEDIRNYYAEEQARFAKPYSPEQQKQLDKLESAAAVSLDIQIVKQG